MFKLKAPDGSNNLCGKNVARLRREYKPPLTQRELAKNIQLIGYDVDHHFVRRIENGERFVTDIELCILAKVFGVRLKELVKR